MNGDHWWNDTDREKPKYSEKNLSQFHFLHYKSHIDYPVCEPGHRYERPATNCLSHGRAVLKNK